MVAATTEFLDMKHLSLNDEPLYLHPLAFHFQYISQQLNPVKPYIPFDMFFSLAIPTENIHLRNVLKKGLLFNGVLLEKNSKLKNS